jgi:hypothetical protein
MCLAEQRGVTVTVTADAARMSLSTSAEVRYSRARRSAFFGVGGANFAEKVFRRSL